MPPTWYLDLADTAQWVFFIGLIVWIAQYSLIAKWWNNPLGRSIVWLAVVSLVILGPSVAYLAAPKQVGDFIQSGGYAWLEGANLFFAAFVIVSRVVLWYRLRERRAFPNGKQ